jgi:hypothetical protein
MQQYSYHGPLMTTVERFAGRAALILSALSILGCGKTDSAPPVATVSLSISKKQVPVGSVVDLTYRFQVGADARISADYRVFSHLNRDDGTMIWNDDHDLADPVRTSRWQPGQIVEYTRTRFVPAFSYLGPATIEVGLYRDDERLPLAGPDPADRESTARSYKVATLELLPRTESIQLYRLSGWHGPEYASEDPALDWQWTQRVATLSLRNPRRDVTLFLEFDSRPDLFPDQPQQVSIYAGQTLVTTFPAASRAVSLQRIPVTAAQLGGGDMASLRIEVDRTFVPARHPNAGNDVRELGIRVYHAHVDAP